MKDFIDKDIKQNEKYNEYLDEHIENVKKGYYWMMDHFSEWLDERIEDPDYFVFGEFIFHDSSKYSKEEYEPYANYFYGNKSFKTVQEFNYAWLHHIHNNKHHWQYWVLNNDDPNEGEKILDMPFDYILEMVCDWWSFSWKTGDLFEIFNWYDQHKDYIKLSDKTRNTVNDILNKIKEELLKNE